MISKWIPDLPRETFFRENFQRAPIARPGTVDTPHALMDWERIERLVDAGADILLVRNSKLLPGDERRSFLQVRALFDQGYSIVLRRCESHDPVLRRLADDFARELEGDVSIQVYATPADFHSFSWHYDCEDVFIAQSAGTKEYFLRRNTVNPEPHIARMPRDMHVELERTPTIGSTLIAGDFLYIPRGWWHVAKARQEALSISVGVLSPAAGGHSRGDRIFTTEAQRTRRE